MGSTSHGLSFSVSPLSHLVKTQKQVLIALGELLELITMTLSCLMTDRLVLTEQLAML